MPLSPRSLPSAERPHAVDAPFGFREWSSHVGDRVPPTGQAPASQRLLPGIDLTHPLAKVAAVAFIGYTFGRLMHRKVRKAPPSPPAQHAYRPDAPDPYRVQPTRDRSDIRFR